ncbi:hypothetical protein F2Q69_00026341 [Brassica cretica]|uniref:Uncharacterized protein n=1 Tax=Brassica cretica TaxID=69181 RepID=A0A8S9S0U3_BRACR|nr:hypothetical protein F2Q69_00026341 [Brassica cretica]
MTVPSAELRRRFHYLRRWTDGELTAKDLGLVDIRYVFLWVVLETLEFSTKGWSYGEQGGDSFIFFSSLKSRHVLSRVMVNS